MANDWAALRLERHAERLSKLGVERVHDLRALKTSDALGTFLEQDAGLSRVEAARLVTHLGLPKGPLGQRGSTLALPLVFAGALCLSFSIFALFPERFVAERHCGSLVRGAEQKCAVASEARAQSEAGLQELQRQLDAVKDVERKLREELAAANKLSTWVLNQTEQLRPHEEQRRTQAALATLQWAMLASAKQRAAPAPLLLDGPHGAEPARGATERRPLPLMLSGVAKTLLRAGTGAQPRGADEVRLDYACRLADGEESAAATPNRSSTMILNGSGVLLRMGDSPPLPGLDAALRSMRHGERALFSISAAEAFGNEGDAAAGVPPGSTAHCELALLALTQVEDVSAAADRSVLKTRLVAGSGVETPADGASVLLRATARATNGSVLNRTGDSAWQMSLGDGSCAEGLRLGLMSMQRAESARFNISAPLARDPTLGLRGDEPVTVEVELLGFTQARALQQMGGAELLQHVTELKEAANRRFGAGERAAACAEYARGWHLLNAFRASPGEDGAPDDDEPARAKLELALRLNSAACALADGAPAQALSHADAALALSAGSAKAHYRRGQALRGLGQAAAAEAAFRAVLEVDPRNKEAHTELAALAEQRQPIAPP